MLHRMRSACHISVQSQVLLCIVLQQQIQTKVTYSCVTRLNRTPVTESCIRAADDLQTAEMTCRQPRAGGYVGHAGIELRAAGFCSSCCCCSISPTFCSSTSRSTADESRSPGDRGGQRAVRECSSSGQCSTDLAGEKLALCPVKLRPAGGALRRTETV